MVDVRLEIVEMVVRETRAWDSQDVELLLTVFHPDMVWPWPNNPKAHDPIDWNMGFGRYHHDRWRENWQGLFDTHKLIHNKREIKKIMITEQGDGAFAVVDIDTLWRDKDGDESHWKGRVCKVYSKVGDQWKMTMHTGALQY